MILSDTGTDWWPATVAGFGGALLLAWGGWLLNRRRARKALAKALFLDAKRARMWWADALDDPNRNVGPPESYLTTWRTVQERAVDLLPGMAVRRLTELQWGIDDVSSGVVRLYPGTGPLDHWLLAYRAERELARIAGEQLDPAAEKKLAEVEAKYGAPPR